MVFSSLVTNFGSHLSSSQLLACISTPAAWPWKRGMGSGGQRCLEACAPYLPSGHSCVEGPGPRAWAAARGLGPAATSDWLHRGAGEEASTGGGQAGSVPSPGHPAWYPIVHHTLPPHHTKRSLFSIPLFRWKDRGWEGICPKRPGSG